MDPHHGGRGGGQHDAGVQGGRADGPVQEATRHIGLPLGVQAQQAADQEGLRVEVGHVLVLLLGSFGPLHQPRPPAAREGGEHVRGLDERFEIRGLVRPDGLPRPVLEGAGAFRMAEGGRGARQIGVHPRRRLDGDGLGQIGHRVPCRRVAHQGQGGGAVGQHGRAQVLLVDLGQQPLRLGQQPPVLTDRPALEGGDRDDRQRPCGLSRRDGEKIGNGTRYLLQRLKTGTRLVAQQQTQEEPDLTARPGAQGALVEDLPQGGGHLRAGAGVQRDAGQLQRDPVADDGGGAPRRASR